MTKLMLANDTNEPEIEDLLTSFEIPNKITDSTTADNVGNWKF
jgi:hypothetical protein